jgi:predicted Zn-dependent peptidase
VVLEEMRMIEDTPDEILHDRATEVHWGAHPLARRIIGTARHGERVHREAILSSRGRTIALSAWWSRRAVT